MVGMKITLALSSDFFISASPFFNHSCFLYLNFQKPFPPSLSQDINNNSFSCKILWILRIDPFLAWSVTHFWCFEKPQAYRFPSHYRKKEGKLCPDLYLNWTEQVPCPLFGLTFNGTMTNYLSTNFQVSHDFLMKKWFSG